MKRTARGPMIEVRHSAVHGDGVFALRRIRTGTRIIEYLGERVSHALADARYDDKDPNDNHTFLFTVDKRTVIDAAIDGNAARFINHSCNPNCESDTEKRRVFIGAIRTIQPGEELNYDYSIQRDDDDPPDVDQVYACRCRAVNCRGSMLEPRKAPVGKSPARRGRRKKTGGMLKRSAATKPASRSKHQRPAAAKPLKRKRGAAGGRSKPRRNGKRRDRRSRR